MGLLGKGGFFFHYKPTVISLGHLTNENTLLTGGRYRRKKQEIKYVKRKYQKKTS